MKIQLTAFFALGLVTLPSALASSIVPGTMVSPDVFTNTTGYTLLGNVSGNINPVPGNSFSATYMEWVFRDVNNVFCNTCLDFFVLFSNAGPGTAERLSTSAFDSFSLDVGYNTVGVSGGPSAPSGGIVPQNVDRSANGNVIGFNFLPPGSAVNSGQSSALLEIQTNAVLFTSGFVSVQDGVAGFGAGFQPTAVPEPKSMALLVGAFLLLISLRRTAPRSAQGR